VVGLIGLIVDGNEAEIEPVIVNRRYSGKGMGTQLVETVVAETRRRSVNYLDVKPMARNVSTISFRYKLGFRNLGHIDMSMGFSNHTWKSGLEIHKCRFNYSRKNCGTYLQLRTCFSSP
jgi:GNAT superfamily N-acetyltransferase